MTAPHNQTKKKEINLLDRHGEARYQVLRVYAGVFAHAVQENGGILEGGGPL